MGACRQLRPPLTSARGGSVLKWLLEKHGHGQSLAEALRENVPLSRLVEAGQGSASVPEMEILLHWTAEEAKTLSEEDREARFQEVISGVSDQDTLSDVLVCTTQRNTSYISVATFLLKQGARARDAIALAIRRKRVALVSQLLDVAKITAEGRAAAEQAEGRGEGAEVAEEAAEEAERAEASGSGGGLELLSAVLEKVEGEVQNMDPDLSAKEMLQVLGKVAYGAEQWAKIEGKVKGLHPVRQPAEYKKWVLQGLQDLATWKKEQAQQAQAKKQAAQEATTKRARLDSDYEDMLDQCSDDEDDWSSTETETVTQAVSGAAATPAPTQK